MASSVTGVGELIMRAGLARAAAEAAADRALDLDSACAAAMARGILQAKSIEITLVRQKDSVKPQVAAHRF